MASALAFLPDDDPPPSKWPILGARTDREELQIQFQFRKDAKAICPGVRVVAVPNGTHIASRYGRAKANKEGRSAGFPDLMCIWPGGTAYIEFKAGKSGSVDENQARWLDWLRDAGFPCVVSRHEEHALGWLKSLGAPFREKVGL